MSAMLFALMIVAAILFPVILYVAIENETRDTQVMDRAEAERQVKRKSGRDQSHSRERAEDHTGEHGDRSGEGYSDDDHWGHSRLEDEQE